MARPGVELSTVEKAIDEEMARFLAEGPSPDELARVKVQSLADFVRGIERIGGFGGKSDILARSQVFGGAPEAYKTNLMILEKTTVDEVLAAARKWLSDGVYVLEILPFPSLETAVSQIDRTRVPTAGDPPDVKFSALERTTLSNGLKVILSRRDSIPVVNFTLAIEGGFATDQTAKAGTASLAMNVLDEGTHTRNALQISEEAAKLGAVLGTGAGIDDVTVTLSALKTNLDPSLSLFADIALNPSFPEAEFHRLQKQTLARIKQEKAEPIGIAIRLLPKLLYGADHPYGKPLSGTGTEESVSSMTRDELVGFHRAWFKPNNATIIVVGAVGMDEIKSRLEKLFGGWSQGASPKLEIKTIQARTSPEVYLIDKPGAPSSLILAGELALPKANPEEIAIESLNDLLGGTFISRLNMNLREEKHWSYGASTLVLDTRRQRIFGGYANVQTDKTAESVREMRKEFSNIVGSRPPTAEELDRVKSGKVLGLPGRWETNSSVASSIHEMVSFGLPEDYFDTYAAKVKGLTQTQVASAAKSLVKPEGMVYVVVGDRSKVEAGLKALGLGDLKLLDADGNPVANP
jgi:zinc protease